MGTGDSMEGDAADGGRSFGRARLLRLLAGAGLVTALLPVGLSGGAGAMGPTTSVQDAAVGEGLANVELPPALGETDLRVYIEATGHTLGGVFLDYWRATGAAAGFGDPISEPFAAANGYYSQAFERAVLQHRPEFLYTVEPIVRPLPLGRMVLDERLGAVRADGKRVGGGGDRRADAWRSLDRGEATVERAAAGGVYVEAVGHTISGAFRDWYERHEGDFYLGNPLGEPVRERGRTVQWFEGGLLMSDGEGVALAPLAKELAPWLGIDTERVPRNDLPAYDESLFLKADNPDPDGGDLDASGPKRIEVDLSEQRLWAYQGDTLVTTSLVTTGLAPNTTEQGRFRVRLKYPEQDMAGFTDATGEVVAAGDGTNAPVAGAVGSYEVDDVPDVMYVNLDAEALHGAYWRDTFGAPGSHGCINLPLDVAAFLYGWAPLGTQVLIYE